MTRNQIAYWELEELKRHNSRTESQKDVELVETGRHNFAVEGETTRHNVAEEAVKGGTLAETVRHNRVYERETNRHNTANEDIESRKVAETGRHNLATETQARNELKETTRHNQENETIGYINAGANAGRSIGSAIGATSGLLLSMGSSLINAAGRNIKKNRETMVRQTNKVAHNLERSLKRSYKSVTGREYKQPKITLDNRHGGSRGGNYNNKRKKGRS